MQATHSNTQYKNESKHSEMGPVRHVTQSRELLVCSYVCASHCAQLLHTILHRTDLIVFPLNPPDNHHCSDDVCLREGGNSIGAYASINSLGRAKCSSAPHIPFILARDMTCLLSFSFRIFKHLYALHFVLCILILLLLGRIAVLRT